MGSIIINIREKRERRGRNVKNEWVSDGKKRVPVVLPELPSEIIRHNRATNNLIP